MEFCKDCKNLIEYKKSIQLNLDFDKIAESLMLLFFLILSRILIVYFLFNLFTSNELIDFYIISKSIYGIGFIV
jgi:hypothetical protein